MALAEKLLGVVIFRLMPQGKEKVEWLRFLIAYLERRRDEIYMETT